MPLCSIPYHFSQRFPFSAAAVLRWATDYHPEDIELFGMRGRRRIHWLCDDTVLLTDTFARDDGRHLSKQKLVRIYPDRLRWTSTHLTGPNRYSQFLYELVAEGKHVCRLEFTGRHIEEREPPSREALLARARELKRGDALVWRNLARAMARQA
ncbi:MAG TPA: hypothetical protein VGQ83_31550 [Polyangia bacterium]|jgi:hypothetical protein